MSASSSPAGRMETTAQNNPPNANNNQPMQTPEQPPGSTGDTPRDLSPLQLPPSVLLNAPVHAPHIDANGHPDLNLNDLDQNAPHRLANGSPQQYGHEAHQQDAYGAPHAIAIDAQQQHGNGAQQQEANGALQQQIEAQNSAPHEVYNLQHRAMQQYQRGNHFQQPVEQLSAGIGRLGFHDGGAASNSNQHQHQAALSSSSLRLHQPQNAYRNNCTSTCRQGLPSNMNRSPYSSPYNCTLRACMRTLSNNNNISSD